MKAKRQHKKKQLTLRQLIANLAIDPETGVVTWAPLRRPQPKDEPQGRNGAAPLNKALEGLTFPKPVK